jgi:predicted phosphoribosyltransferase
LIIAVPVAPRNILKSLNQVANDVIVSYILQRILWLSALFYENSAQIGDDEIKEIMKRYGYNI